MWTVLSHSAERYADKSHRDISHLWPIPYYRYQQGIYYKYKPDQDYRVYGFDILINDEYFRKQDDIHNRNTVTEEIKL